MTRARHIVACACGALLDRPINVKHPVCGKCRLEGQRVWLQGVREQAARYREVLDLLGIADEEKFLAELRRRKGAQGKMHFPDKSRCPTCGLIIGKYGSHRRVCATRSPDDRASFRERYLAGHGPRGGKRARWPEEPAKRLARLRAWRKQKRLEAQRTFPGVAA